MSIVKLEHISKYYQDGLQQVTAVNDVNLEINEGEFIAIMGSSGSGKSTLLSVMGGLNQPSRGNVIIDNINIYQLNHERRADFRSTYMGFVFQQFHLISYLTALENVMLPLAIVKGTAQKHLEAAKTALDRVGLENKYNRLPNQLSGGEQERVAIARAIVNQPPIVFADEPTGSLDSISRRSVMQLFTSLNRGGLTVIMVTHDEANLPYVNRTTRMQDGKLVRDED